ncbi:MAG: hypothetical protein ACI9FJ_001319 [Alteromonadaceae bacterium]|jgi:hypothetical protein
MKLVLSSPLTIGLLLISGLIQGCTTVTIDQARMTSVGVTTTLTEGKSIVVVGRRSGSDYETEPDLISCLGKELGKGKTSIKVIPEDVFVDQLYPWFEPRTAPIRVNDLFRLLEFEELAKATAALDMEYLIWVDGSTQTTNKSGEITCALGVGGISCFGFGSWDKKADYEATIWDYSKRKLVGKISGTADGTTYIPAIVIPIPIIAPVQADVCKGMGKQLRTFFNVNPEPSTSKAKVKAS